MSKVHLLSKTCNYHLKMESNKAVTVRARTLEFRTNDIHVIMFRYENQQVEVKFFFYNLQANLGKTTISKMVRNTAVSVRARRLEFGTNNICHIFFSIWGNPRSIFLSFFYESFLFLTRPVLSLR